MSEPDLDVEAEAASTEEHVEPRAALDSPLANGKPKPKPKGKDKDTSPAQGDVQVPKSRKLGIQHVAVRDATISPENVVFYNVRVRTRQDSWVVSKRYSQFEQLHSTLSRRYRRLPFLPAKHYKLIKNHTDAGFIEHRRALLDNYLKKLIKHRDAQVAQELVGFLHSGEEKENVQYKNVAEEETAAQQEYSSSHGAPAGFEYPGDQEVTSVEISGTRKMSDHVLYHIKVGNRNLRSSYASWSVLRRFTQFWEMDQNVRKALGDAVTSQMPQPPQRRLKYVYNHKDDKFIEERRVLLQNYLRQCLRIAEVAKNEHFLEFLGVDLND